MQEKVVSELYRFFFSYDSADFTFSFHFRIDSKILHAIIGIVV